MDKYWAQEALKAIEIIEVQLEKTFSSLDSIKFDIGIIKNILKEELEK